MTKKRTWRFDENGTYLVAGGLGGIGRSILRWMVGRGAKHLLVPSRSGAVSAAALEVVRELSDENVAVLTPKCDVSSKESLSHMLLESAATLPPIRGCIVATMVLNVSCPATRCPQTPNNGNHGPNNSRIYLGLHV
jgi:NAD(P)-dependent dehydrogenase (short-subunit alcohol dehydrogenase family)